MSLLITSAIEAELAPLAEVLQAKKIDSGWESPIARLLPLGIGPIQALSSLLRFKEPITELLFIGTAGYFDADQFQIGELVQAQSVTLFDGATLLGQAHFALMQNSPPLIASGPTLGLKAVTVANSLSVTRGTTLARAVQQDTNCAVENLELYGVAYGAAQLEVPWAALLGLTNQVGPEGQQQWQTNHKNIALQSSQFLVEHGFLDPPHQRM